MICALHVIQTNRERLWHCLLHWRDWIRAILSSLASGRRIPAPPTISFFKAALMAPLKSCQPFFLYGCLWLLRRGEITVIQMLSDFNTPVNIRKGRTTPSSTMPRKKKTRPVFWISYPPTSAVSRHKPLPSQKADCLTHTEHRTVSAFIKTSRTHTSSCVRRRLADFIMSAGFQSFAFRRFNEWSYRGCKWINGVITGRSTICTWGHRTTVYAWEKLLGQKGKPCPIHHYENQIINALSLCFTGHRWRYHQAENLHLWCYV